MMSLGSCRLGLENLVRQKSLAYSAGPLKLLGLGVYTLLDLVVLHPIDPPVRIWAYALLGTLSPHYWSLLCVVHLESGESIHSRGV